MAVAAEYRIAHSTFLAWPAADRDKAIWWWTRQQQTCPSCGTRPDEWETDHNAYIARPRRCRGCEVRQRAEEDPGLKEAGRGVSVVLERSRGADLGGGRGRAADARPVRPIEEGGAG